jgi:hypothetical protein
MGAAPCQEETSNGSEEHFGRTCARQGDLGAGCDAGTRTGMIPQTANDGKKSRRLSLFRAGSEATGKEGA